MYDIWVSGAYDARVYKQAMGAWICPDLGLYAVTKRSRSIDLNDGIRIGCAMAILSALNNLGENLIVHIPKYPAPRWVSNPSRPVQLPNLLYRLLYQTEVHPRIESGSIVIVPDYDEIYTSQLSELLTKGEVPRCI